MLADKETVLDTEIDVDALDDAAFADLKGKMAGEIDKEEAGETEKEAPATAVAKTPDAAPDANAAKADDDEEDGQKSETVPHGQFHRERERRKQAETERQQIADNYAKLLERTQALLEVSQPRATEEARTDEPDPTDPLQQIAWLVDKVRKGEMSREEAGKQAREEGERQVFANNIKAVEDQFKATTPDYEQALQFAAKSRDEELALMYPQMTAEARRDFVLQEWNGVTRNAVATGQNPAETVYKFAHMRGYQKAAPEAAPQTDAVKEIAEREETRKAAMSLGKAGGGVTQTGAISPEQLLDMSDAEFAAYKTKHGSVARAFAA